MHSVLINRFFSGVTTDLAENPEKAFSTIIGADVLQDTCPNYRFKALNKRESADTIRSNHQWPHSF